VILCQIFQHVLCLEQFATETTQQASGENKLSRHSQFHISQTPTVACLSPLLATFGSDARSDSTGTYIHQQTLIARLFVREIDSMAAKYWPYEWMDQFHIQHVDTARLLLANPVALNELMARASKASPPHETGQRSGESIVAVRGIELSGRLD
jgi:hypothetical protein